MSKIVQKNQPCPDTITCGSSDALQIYDTGTGFCFSCTTRFSAEEIAEGSKAERPKPIPDQQEKAALTPLEEIRDKYPVKGFQERGIPTSICEFFKVKCSFGSNGKIDTHYYPYGTGYNCRKTADKTFYRVGSFSKLFGQDLFQSTGKRLVITEGELDAMTVAYATFKRFGKIYPVVTMGSASNVKMLIEHRDWIRNFEEVVLYFDNDENGQRAKDEAIRIIGYDKVKIAKHSTCKDANELLMMHANDLVEGGKAVYQVILDAETFKPSGIIGKEELWNQLVEYNDKESLPFPPCLEGVNKKLKGKREGEITLFISGTGSGKSTIFREDMLFTLASTPSDVKIGILSLEEAPAETARKLAGMHLNRNPAHEEIPIDELKVGFDAVFGDDRVVLLDHQGSISDNSIIDQLEYMCLIGCKYIYIDHITILVSEGVDKLVGNEAQDKMMNDLLRLTKRHPVWIGLISHLRKVNVGSTSFEQGKLPTMDDIRGSGSIKQISFDIIAFARDMMADEEQERNTIKMAVLKARFTGLTGEVMGAVYCQETGRLSLCSDSDALVLKEESFKLIEEKKKKPSLMSAWRPPEAKVESTNE
jgi:twinkle protein